MSLLKEIKDIMYPAKCAVCDSLLERQERYLCKKCHKKLPLIDGVLSNRCAKCSKEIDMGKSLCLDCQKNKHVFEQAHGVFKYNDVTGKIIAQLKYFGKTGYVEGIAYDMAANTHIIMKKWQPQIIIPVPLHISKLRTRGFNQAGVIADEFAKLYDIACADRILVRTHKTLPQKYFDNVERKRNLQSAFAVNVKELKKYPGVTRVLLVDDIYTTGSTMEACAQALKMAGIKEVYCLCMCIGNGM